MRARRSSLQIFGNRTKLYSRFLFYMKSLVESLLIYWGALFLAGELLLEIWSELIDEFIDHAKWKGHRDPRECGTDTATSLRIIGI